MLWVMRAPVAVHWIRLLSRKSHQADPEFVRAGGANLLAILSALFDHGSYKSVLVECSGHTLGSPYRTEPFVPGRCHRPDARRWGCQQIGLAISSSGDLCVPSLLRSRYQEEKIEN